VVEEGILLEEMRRVAGVQGLRSWEVRLIYVL